MFKFRLTSLLTILIFMVGCKTTMKTDLVDSQLCKNPKLYVSSNMDSLELAELSTLAKNGNPCAQNEMGRRYGLGDGVPKDSKESVYWYQKSALNDLPIAQANLGYMYFKGEGVNVDLKQAKHWFLKAANSGHFEGQRMLGYMYITGSGVDKNGIKAEKWYLLAANQGHVESQYALQHMYSQGDGVKKDSAKAVMWLHRVKGARLHGNVWKK